MKYGILCAMPEEINLLLADITEQKVTKAAGREFYEGKLYGIDVVIALARIGKVAAAATTAVLLDRFQLDGVIFGGTAGGAAASLHVGDVVIADRLVQHDFFTGQDYFRIPLLNKYYFETDLKLSSAMQKAAEQYQQKELFLEIPKKYLDEFHIGQPKTVVGTIASGDQFICENEKKQWLLNHIENLQCVEMESAAVAQVCYECDVPLAVAQVISDSANDDANVDFERFISEAACHFIKGSIKAFLQSV